MAVLYNVDVLAPGITPYCMNQWFYLHITVSGFEIFPPLLSQSPCNNPRHY